MNASNSVVLKKQSKPLVYTMPKHCTTDLSLGLTASEQSRPDTQDAGDCLEGRGSVYV